MSSSKNRRFSRRAVLQLAGASALGAVLSACAPQVVKETVVVEKEVEKIVKETVVIEGTPQVVEKVVTAAAPAAEAAKEIIYGCPSWWLSLLPWTFEAVDLWNTENPTMPVKIVRGEVDAAKLQLEGAAGTTSFDTFCGETAFVNGLQILSTGAVAPWDDLYPEDLKADTIPVFLQEGSFEGKLYLWPSHAETSAVHWRKSMLAEIGRETPGDTWPEYEITCQEIEKNIKTADGNPVHGNGVSLTTWRTWMSIVVNIAGGEAFTEDGYPDVTHPACTAALDQVKRIMAYAPAENYLSEQAQIDAFTNGSEGMMCSLLGHGPTAASQGFGMADWGYGDLPAMPDAKTKLRTTTWSSGFWLFKNSQVKAELGKFMAWMYSQPDFYQKMVTQGAFSPCFKHVMDEEWCPAHVRRNIQATLESATFIPNAENFLVFHSKFMEISKEFYQGSIPTAEEALAQVWEETQKQITLM